MILCDSEIKAALRYGDLIIDPAPATDAISTSSVDLRLGAEFKRWKKAQKGTELTLDPGSSDFSFATVATEFTEAVVPDGDGAIIIRPQELILGTTQERVELPRRSRLAARVEGKSSLGRLGLGVHVTAPTIHAGFRGLITLEKRVAALQSALDPAGGLWIAATLICYSRGRRRPARSARTSPR